MRKTPRTRRSVTVGKMLSKLVAFVVKCHDKMDKSFFKAVDFDEEEVVVVPAHRRAGMADACVAAVHERAIADDGRASADGG